MSAPTPPPEASASQLARHYAYALAAAIISTLTVAGTLTQGMADAILSAISAAISLAVTLIAWWWSRRAVTVTPPTPLYRPRHAAPTPTDA